MSDASFDFSDITLPSDEATGVKRGLVAFCGHLLALIVRHQAPRDTKKTSLTASGFEFLNFDVIFEFSDIILSLDVTSLVRGEVGVLN